MTWREYRVKDAAGITNGHPFDATQFSERGELALVRIRDLVAPAFTTYVPRDSAPEGVLLNDGDIVIGMDGDFNAVLWRRGEAALNQRLCALRTNPSFDRRFLAYLLPAPLKAINDLTYSTTVKHLSSKQIADIRFLAPDAVQQGRIADYLDRETAQIDALIAKQERLIATLRERRNNALESLLTQYVARGTRLKWSLHEIDERARNSGGQWPLLSVSITWGVRERVSARSHDTAIDLSNYKRVRAGQLVINRMRAFQGALGVAMIDGVVSPDYAVLAPESTVNPEWLAATMKTPAFVGEMTSRLKGIGTTEGGNVRTPRINVSDLFEIRLDIPSRHIQDAQAAAVTNLNRKVDALVAKAERFIELSKERRAALITAAVTGQLEIPG
ncbi:restriction endonuclease subunit S [Microbacterium sp. NPDC055521]